MMSLLLEAALRTAVLAIAVWAVLRILRIRDAHAEKRVWTLITAVSLAMPALMRAATLPVPTRISVALPGHGVAAQLIDAGSRAGLATALSAIYLFVAAVLLLRFLASVFDAYLLYRRAGGSATNLCAGSNLRISDAVRAPCTFASGILLPPGFDAWSPRARAAALAHERSHVAHRDCYRLWLASLYSCIFWFNPTTWWIRRRLQLLAELTSDQEALREIGDSAAYAKLLVHLAADTSPAPAAVAMSGAAHLAARINRIMENKMSSYHLSAGRQIALAGASLVAIALCSSCVGGPHVLTPAEDAKVSWVSGAPLGQFYPAALRHNGVEGYVVMKLTIDGAGQVTDAKFTKESPAGSGLGLAATNAARTFRFNNTLDRPVIKTIQVRFALKD